MEKLSLCINFLKDKANNNLKVFQDFEFQEEPPGGWRVRFKEGELKFKYVRG